MIIMLSFWVILPIYCLLIGGESREALPFLPDSPAAGETRLPPPAQLGEGPLLNAAGTGPGVHLRSRGRWLLADGSYKETDSANLLVTNNLRDALRDRVGDGFDIEDFFESDSTLKASQSELGTLNFGFESRNQLPIKRVAMLLALSAGVLGAVVFFARDHTEVALRNGIPKHSCGNGNGGSDWSSSLRWEPGVGIHQGKAVGTSDQFGVAPGETTHNAGSLGGCRGKLEADTEPATTSSSTDKGSEVFCEGFSASGSSTNQSDDSFDFDDHSLQNGLKFESVTAAVRRERDLLSNQLDRMFNQLDGETRMIRKQISELKNKIRKMPKDMDLGPPSEKLVQAQHLLAVRQAEMYEAAFMSSEAQNGSFVGSFKSTGINVLPTVLRENVTRFSLQRARQMTEANTVISMTDLEAAMSAEDRAAREDFAWTASHEAMEGDFYPCQESLPIIMVQALAHLKLMGPVFEETHQNEFYIEFDRVVNTFTDKHRYRNTYKVERILGVGSTALMLLAREINEEYYPVGEKVALKVLVSSAKGDLQHRELLMAQLVAGEETLLAAATAQQLELKDKLSAEAASKRTGVLYPTRKMMLAGVHGSITTRRSGGVLISPHVYAYPLMSANADVLMDEWDLRSRMNDVDYFSKRLIVSMAHLHSMGVVHLDAKGDNMLIGNDGVPYLCDFSFIRPVNSGFPEQAFLNPLFLDPEGVISNRSDAGGDVASKQIDSWRVGLAILDVVNAARRKGAFNPSTFKYDENYGLSPTLVNIVWDLTSPMRSKRLLPAQIIARYPEFFAIVPSDSVDTDLSVSGIHVEDNLLSYDPLGVSA